MRKKIFKIIESTSSEDSYGQLYDWSMLIVIFASIVPLAFKSSNTLFEYIDYIATAIFIVDYILRWFTADYKFDDHSIKAFVKYPFTFMAIIDLVSILPTFSVLNSGFRLLKLVRLTRMIRVFRVFRAVRYSKNVRIIVNVLKNSKESLFAVGTFAIAYIFIAALIIFNVEPDSFNTYFDAIYWATVSLTTVGYGDIYPVTTIGRLVTMISSALGIAIIALPSGILTAGYMEALKKNQSEDKIE